ncbi:Polyadenylate-binding protein-interacting protein 10 [Hibiscus syriacus]|uniref:Polyadenylate-binding protein-interacting protein 10 n=1 Tax=Hibiscus syriacus TaxID=106335 RepID=A0A6A3BQW8_HIBSY|nr:polyadenylate-binding protein-interacting protein 10-like [Hibiscus syriacus]KAE8717482.1 Polyadenylate-binding protein-interacting protein 10 [Hibiscus syriacus]
MTVADNSGAKIRSSGRNAENTSEVKSEEEKPAAAVNGNDNGGSAEKNKQKMLIELSSVENGGNGEILKKEMSDLAEMLSKLNPTAEEFRPPSIPNNQNLKENRFSGNGKKKSNDKRSQGKRMLNKKTDIIQEDDAIRNTVYVTGFDHQVTEELLAGLFLSCGPIVDCRICSDHISALRFAFVEFYNEDDAKAALNLSGTILGFYPLKVLPSKTAIAPVNPTYLPNSEVEREMCLRTVYCTNIHKKVTKTGVKLFFEFLCGKVQRLRLLKDSNHPTNSAFIEFTTAASAIAALNCSGAILGLFPIRVATSKTPIRRRAPHPATH